MPELAGTLISGDFWHDSPDLKDPPKLRVTLLAGIEMSFCRYRDFSIVFSASRSSLTSNLHDVEPQKARTGESQEQDNLDAEQQNAETRYQKRHLDTKKKMHPKN